MRNCLLLVALLFFSTTASADDWPQWLGPQRDGVWREEGIVKELPKDGPKVLWRVKIGGGYTGPAVVGDRVYVMDKQDLPPNPEAPKEKGKTILERALCLDARTGKEIWKHTWEASNYVLGGWPAGPRVTPVVDGDNVYVLGAMGELFCLDAKTGKPVWHREFLKDYIEKAPVWGWSAHPVVEGDHLYCLVGGEGSAVVCFDKKTGKELWRALTSEEVCYAPPVLTKAGGTMQLVVWLSDSLSGLDPKTGKVHWTVPYPEDGKAQRPAVSIATPIVHKGYVFVSAFYHGGLMVKLADDEPKAEVVWRSKSKNPNKPDTVNIIMTTPVIEDDHIYAVGGFGELRCLDLKTGKQIWETYEPIVGKKEFFGTAFFVKHDDRYFIFNELGDLIIGKLSPKGYEEVSRAHILDPSQNARGRQVVWCHPAFAHKRMYVRNDKEIICVDLAAK